MGAIGETGDEWIVEPEPIIVPADEPHPVPANVPAEPSEEPVGAGRAGV